MASLVKVLSNKNDVPIVPSSEKHKLLPSAEPPQKILKLTDFRDPTSANPTNRTIKRTRRGKRKKKLVKCLAKHSESGYDFKLQRHKMLYFKSFRRKFPSNHILEEVQPDENGAFKFLKIIFPTSPHCVEALIESNLVSLMKDLIKRHKKTHLWYSVKHFCPIPTTDLENHTLQISKLCSSHNQVFNLLRTIFHKIIPIDLLGSKKNFQTFVKYLKVLITAGIRDVLRTSWFTYGLKVTDIAWLRDHSDNNHNSRVLESLLKWLLDYCLDVLKTLFYVTESGFGKKKLFFYRIDVWQQFQNKCLKALQDEQKFVPIDNIAGNDIVVDDPLLMVGPAKFRILPKLSSFRPIINFGKTVDNTLQQRISNMNLILKSIFKETPSLNRRQCTTAEELYQVWTTFFQIPEVKNSSQVYAVVVDVKDCFGSLRHDLLWQLSLNTLRKHGHPNYIFDPQYTSVIGSRNAVVRTVKCAVPNPKGLFDRSVQESTLHTYFHNCIIKTGRKPMRLSQGVPQGGPLSSDLCNLYLNHFEQEVLGDLGDRPHELLLRNADDYLFLSLSPQRAIQFLQTIKKGSPKYNIFVNRQKIQTNFPRKKHQNSKQNSVLWSGLELIPTAGSAQINFSKNTGIDSQYHLTIDTKMDENVLNKKIKAASALTNKSIFLDINLNGEKVVLATIFEKTLLTALQLHAMLIRQHPRDRVRNSKVLHGLMMTCTRKMRNKTLKLIPKGQPKKRIAKGVTWFSLQGFLYIFQRYAAMYKTVTPLIRSSLVALEKEMPWRALQDAKELLYQLPTEKTKTGLNL